MSTFGNRNECQQALMDASADLDGELSPFRQKRMQQHLSACMPCATEVVRMGQVTAGVRHRAPECAPAFELHAMPQSRPQRRRSRRRVAVPAFSAVAVAAAVVAAFVLAAAPAKVANESASTAAGPEFVMPLQPTLVQLKQEAMHRELYPAAYGRHGFPI